MASRPSLPWPSLGKSSLEDDRPLGQDAAHVLTRSGRLVDGYLWKSTSDSSWRDRGEEV